MKNTAPTNIFLAYLMLQACGVVWAQSPGASAPPVPGLYRLDAAAVAPAQGKELPTLPFVLPNKKITGAALSFDAASKTVKLLLLPASDDATPWHEQVLPEPPRDAKGQSTGSYKAPQACPAFVGKFDNEAYITRGWYERSDAFCELGDQHYAALLLAPRQVALQLPYERFDGQASSEGMRHSAFALEQPRPYSDIFYRSRPVPLHAQPGKASPVVAQVQGYLAVLGHNPQWQQVEHFAANNIRTTGWLADEDSVVGQWVVQSASTAAHRFEVAAIQPKGQYEPLAWDGIRVTTLATGATQFIEGAGIAYPDGAVQPQGILTLVDANFDGHPDLQLPLADGGAGPNSVDAFYLYNPKDNTFVLHEKLSELTQVQIDPKKRQIHSAARASCCSHLDETWDFHQGTLRQVYSRDATSTGGWLVTTTCRLRRGKQVCTIRRSRQ